MRQKTCRSIECEVEWLRQEAIKQGKRKTRQALAAIKPRSKWLEKAQFYVNKYVRTYTRIHGLPCISCQRPLSGTFHAGHYISVGVSSALRFDVDFESGGNINGQCVQCNRFGAGKQSDYRLGLIDRYGIESAERLDNAPRSRKWTIEELKAIIAEFKQKTKDLDQ